MSFKKRFKAKKKMSKAKRIFVITALVLLLTVSVAGAVGVWYLNYLSDYEARLLPPNLSWPGYDADDEPMDVDEAFNEKIINIALLGFDRAEHRDEKYDGRYRPDTIIVMAINLETGDVDMVSIPRDSLVNIYNQSGVRDKINSSYVWGWDTRHTGLTDPDERHASGLNTAVQTVSMFLHVPIHYWVGIDMDGVAEVVNIMGGVWYDVERNYYDLNGQLILTKGYQKLNGNNFLRLIRNRNIGGGDIQRARNQQDVMVATFDQLKQANQLLKIPEIYLSMRNRVDTNMTAEQMAALALFGSRRVDTSQIKNHIVSGNSAVGRLREDWQRSLYYYIIDPGKLAALVKEVWGVSIDPGPKMRLFPPLPDEEPSEESDHALPPDSEPEPNPVPGPDPTEPDNGDDNDTDDGGAGDNDDDSGDE